MNKQFLKVISIYSIIMIGANLIHPITPQLIRQMEFPDIMFGVSLATMHFTNFIFSNFWGKLSDVVGRRKIMLIGCLGYALGQMLFSYATTIPLLVGARLVSGLFTGAFTVPILAFISDISKPDEVKKHFSIFVTSLAIDAAIGYFIGGQLGTLSLRYPFYLQATIFIISGLIIRFGLKEGKSFTNQIDFGALVHTLNPFRVFFNSKVKNKVVFILLGMSFFVYFANTMYDNSFAYYLTAQLHMPPSVNGIFKAITGITTLILNISLIAIAMRKYAVNNVLLVLLSTSIVLALAIIISPNMQVFFLMNVVFYVVFMMLIPLQQALIMENVSSDIRGEASGMMNALRAISGILSSLLAGVLYERVPNSLSHYFAYANIKIVAPIFVSVSMLCIAVVIIAYYQYYIKKKAKLS